MRHFIRSIICVMFAVTSLISLKHFVEQSQIFERIREGQEVFEQVNDDVEDIKNYAEESGLISEAKKDTYDRILRGRMEISGQREIFEGILRERRRF